MSGGKVNEAVKIVIDESASAEKAGFRITTEEVVCDNEDAMSVPFLYMKCIK
jgi:hypothetical protein